MTLPFTVLELSIHTDIVLKSFFQRLTFRAYLQHLSMNCHANIFILLSMHYELYMHGCRRGWRSGKFQVSLCVVDEELCYEDYVEMHRELINLHPGVSVPVHG